jgi:peptidoglycan-associated lipoprotein
MTHAQRRTLIAAASVGLLAIFTAACSKKTAAAPPPPPPQVAPPAAAASPAPAPARAAARPAPAPVAQTPRMPSAATRARIDELLAKIEDAYFDYDKADLRPDAVKALQADSAELRDILKDYPDYKLTIEGHCDERGSAEYNMVLGDKRAESAKDYLVEVGIPAAQLNVVSYGKQHPVCDEHDEACWQRNRRIHIVALAEAK